GQKFFVDPRDIVIALEEGDRSHADQILEARTILGKKSQMETCLTATACFAVCAPGRRHIRLVSDDGIKAGGATFTIELDGYAEITVIRERQSVHPDRFGARNQLRNAVGAVEKT